VPQAAGIRNPTQQRTHALQQDALVFDFALEAMAGRMSGRTVASLLTNLALDPFGKIPEFKFCTARAKPVGIRTAGAEQAAGINRPGPLSVGERRLRRDLVLRDDGFGPREIFQQVLAGQDKEVIAELRVLEVDLEQLFIADSQDAAILDAFDRGGPAVVGREETKLAHQTPRRKFGVNFDDPEFA